MNLILNDENLRKYLLGSLGSEAERETLEEQFLFDDEKFQSLGIAEDELIEDYLDENLTADELQRFNLHFLLSAKRRAKVTLIRHLRQIANARLTAPQKIKAAPKPYLFGWSQLFSPPFAWQSAFVVGVLVVCLVGLIVWNLPREKDDVEKGLVALNKAYLQERPLESRISGLNYAPLKNTRGAGKIQFDYMARDLAEKDLLEAVQKNPSAPSFHALGRLYLTNKEFEKAAEQFEKALQLAPASAEIHSDYGAAFLEQAKIAENNNDDAKRLESLARSAEQFNQALNANPRSPVALFNRALCLQMMNLPQQAKQAWEKYLEIDQDSPWADEARQKIERLNTQKSAAKDGKQIVQDFINAYQSQDKERAWLISSRNREMITGKLVSQQLALLFLAASAEEKPLLRQVLLFAGNLEKEKTGDSYFAEIADFYAHLAPEKHAALLEAQTAVNEGYQLNQGKNADYKTAFNKFKLAQEIFEKHNDIWEAKLCDYWLAVCDYILNNFAATKTRLTALADFSQSRNYKWLLSQARTWLGFSADSDKEYSKAINYLKDALAISVGISDAYNQQKILSFLAEEYLQIGQFTAALEVSQKSLNLALQPETSVRQKFRTFNSIGKIFFKLNLYSVAEAFQAEALALCPEVNDPTYDHIADIYLGRIYGRFQRFAEAFAIVEKSRAIARALSNEKTSKNLVALSNFHLAELRRENENCAAAVPLYDQAISTYDELQNPENEYEARKGRLLCLTKSGTDETLQREISGVLALFEKNRQNILEAQNRDTYFDGEQDIYDLAIGYEYGRGNYEKAFNYTEQSRSRALLDMLKNGISLSAKDAEVQFPNTVVPLDLNQLRARLPEQVQLVEYTILPGKVLIWFLTKDDFAVFEKEIPAAELNTKISNYLEILIAQNGKPAAQEVLAKEVQEILLNPAAAKLNPAKQLVIVPDKILARLPFAALISPATGKYLIQDFNLTSAPSANTFVVATEKAREKSLKNRERLLSIGNPGFDRRAFPDLADLPAAKDEAETIAALYQNPATLTGAKATKTAIETESAAVDIIHFAGHYLPDERKPLLSSLIVAGKNQSETTLSNYELLQTKMSRPSLIVLSACQTNVEKYYRGEGLIGVSRTFLAMGVPLIVASQWEIDSDATAALMVKFHRYRRENKLPTAEALRRAQLDLLEDAKGKFQAPFYWAAFTALGGYTEF